MSTLKVYIVLELPWADRCLWANRMRGRHWSAASKARRDQRAIAKAMTMAEMDKLPPLGRMTEMEWEFRPHHARRYDLDNAIGAMKGAQDGIAEALGRDDSTFSPTYIRGARSASPIWGSVIVRMAFEVAGVPAMQALPDSLIGGTR